MPLKSRNISPSFGSIVSPIIDENVFAVKVKNPHADPIYIAFRDDGETPSVDDLIPLKSGEEFYYSGNHLTKIVMHGRTDGGSNVYVPIFLVTQ
ncbi:hypothetical protein ABXV18_24920 [Vibrio owensii]|uniref:hypothetical protein n=1 Tax=Vibrio owensii TaxID=696485 RepID=UPI00339B9535